MQGVKLFHRERPVDFSPPDIFLAGRFLDNKFVVGGSSGMFACLDANRTEMRKHTLRSTDNIFVQVRCRKIPVNFLEIFDLAIVLQFLGQFLRRIDLCDE